MLGFCLAYSRISSASSAVITLLLAGTRVPEERRGNSAASSNNSADSSGHLGWMLSPLTQALGDFGNPHDRSLVFGAALTNTRRSQPYVSEFHLVPARGVADFQKITCNPRAGRYALKSCVWPFWGPWRGTRIRPLSGESESNRTDIEHPP